MYWGGHLPPLHFMGWFGMTFKIIFWDLIIVGLVLLMRWLIQNTSSKAHSGVSTADQNYAFCIDT